MTTDTLQRLIPRAAQAAYLPATDLEWLEPYRERHERLAAQLATAVRVPDRVRRDHDAQVAAWDARVRAAARAGDVPPDWDAQLSAPWLAGLVDTAEARISGLIDEICALLAEVDSACEEHRIDAQVAQVDDGFGGLLAATERKLAGDPAATELPRWAASARQWRQWRNQRVGELQSFKQRRAGFRSDPNPLGGAILRGGTLEDHAAEERERVKRVRAANAALPALDEYSTTTSERS